MLIVAAIIGFLTFFSVFLLIWGGPILIVLSFIFWRYIQNNHLINEKNNKSIRNFSLISSSLSVILFFAMNFSSGIGTEGENRFILLTILSFVCHLIFSSLYFSVLNKLIIALNKLFSGNKQNKLDGK